MERTNLNLNTYFNIQTIFDTLVGETFVGHSCRTHSFRKAWWDTLAHSCRTPYKTLTLMGHFCGTLLWDTLVGHPCKTHLWGTLVGHSCRTLLWDTLAEHSCRTLLWDTLIIL